MSRALATHTMLRPPDAQPERATRIVPLMVRPHPTGAHPITKCDHCDSRAHNVCGAMRVADLEHLSAIALTLTIPDGHGFIDEGSSAEHFFNVTAGTAKIFKQLPDGRRLITGFAGPGHFLGLAHTGSYAFSAEALGDVRLCRYPRDKLRALLAEYPAMEARLLDIASNELVAAQEQMLLLGRKQAHERLASFLLSRSAAVQRDEPEAVVMIDTVALPMSRADIADFLGLTVETVSRNFSRLRRDGVIGTPGRAQVTIRDYAALSALAGGA